MRSFPVGLIFFISLISLSMGVSGEQHTNGGQPAPMDPRDPFIISDLGAPGVIQYWASPGPDVTVVYDEWEIFLFGDIGDQYMVNINGVPFEKGNLTRSYLNLTFDASGIQTGNVHVRIGNNTWTFSNLIIKHEEWYGADGDPAGSTSAKYFTSDLNKAQRNGAIGATIITGATALGVFYAMAWNHNRKGAELDE